MSHSAIPVPLVSAHLEAGPPDPGGVRAPRPRPTIPVDPAHDTEDLQLKKKTRRLGQRWAAVLLAAAPLGCGEAAPDSAFLIADERIELVDLEARLREDDPAVSLFGVGDAVWLDGGGLVVTDMRNGRVVWLTKDFGLVREVGGSGRGPGEFMSPTALERHGDALYVLDPGANRVTVLTLDGGVLETHQMKGPVSSLAVHPELGVLVGSAAFPGYYAERVTDGSETEPFAPIPEELATPERRSAIMPGDYLIATPDGAVHVLDEIGQALVSYDARGERARIRRLPEAYAASVVREREGGRKAFGEAVMGMSLLSGVSLTTDGRLLVLGHQGDIIGLVLDLSRGTATPIMEPLSGPLSWINGGVAGLYDGSTLVLARNTEILRIRTRLVEG